MKPSLLLNDAKAAHDTLVAELTRLFDKLDEETKAERFGSDPRRLVVPFDLSLQLELLKMALSSTKRKDFIAFLRGMGFFHYDILKFLNEYAAIRRIDLTVDWDRLLEYSPEGQARVLSVASAGVTPLWEDALEAMGKSDLILDKDVFQIFEDNIYRIVDCFLMVDDATTEEDVRKALEVIHASMMQPIINANDELFKRTGTKK